MTSLTITASRIELLGRASWRVTPTRHDAAITYTYPASGAYCRITLTPIDDA